MKKWINSKFFTLVFLTFLTIWITTYIALQWNGKRIMKTKKSTLISVDVEDIIRHDFTYKQKIESFSSSILKKKRALKQPFEQTSRKKREVMEPNMYFLKEPKNLGSKCYNNSCIGRQPINWLMVTFVKTFASSYRRRQHIRLTWGALKYVDGARFEIVFIVGKTDKKLQKLLDQEHEIYGDILQIREFDITRKVYLKTLAGMQWASENLPNHYFYSSAADDVIINVIKMQEIVENHKKLVDLRAKKQFPVICMYKTKRNLNHALGQSERSQDLSVEYKMWPDFPDFCYGDLYTMTVKTAGQLWKSSQTETPFLMDDLWITGMLRRKVGMSNKLLVEVLHSPSVSGIFGENPTRSSFKTRETMFKAHSTFLNKTICTCTS